MLAALETLADRLESLPLATRQELVTLVQRFGGFLLNYNRDYLQREGRRPDGEVIGSGQYSSAYKAYKSKYGRFNNTAFIDLKFSGDFLASFILEYDGSLLFHIVANDKKASFLAKYGELLGIRKEDLDDFVSAILEPEIRAFVARYMENIA